MHTITKFLSEKNNKLCVLGTASKDATPWTAVMGYAVLDKNTILLSTHENSRKWHNINENNKVSLVFGFGFDDLYVQCSGNALITNHGDDFSKYENVFFSQNPHAKAFKRADTIFIKVSLKKACVTDFKTTPPTVKEFVV